MTEIRVMDVTVRCVLMKLAVDHRLLDREWLHIVPTHFGIEFEVVEEIAFECGFIPDRCSKFEAWKATHNTGAGFLNHTYRHNKLRLHVPIEDKSSRMIYWSLNRTA